MAKIRAREAFRGLRCMEYKHTFRFLKLQFWPTLSTKPKTSQCAS